MLMLEDDFWCQNSATDDSTLKMRKFDKMLISLRREFKKLLKENDQLKNPGTSTNLSRQDSNALTKVKRSINEPETSSTLNSKKNEFKDCIPTEENDPLTEETSLNNTRTLKKREKTFVENEIPEILSVEFDSGSEQSLLEQYERSKSISSRSENQLQKSPVFCRKRIKSKKSQSPKVDLSSRELSRNDSKDELKIIKKELVIEPQKSIIEDLEPSNTSKSLFCSFQEKKDELFVSPQSNAKLGITKLYNVDTKFLRNGKRLKQTKLILTAEEEKTDVSSRSCSIQATVGESNSIYDLSLFNKIEKFDSTEVEVETPKLSTESFSVKNDMSSDTEIQEQESDDFVDISPCTVNSSVRKNKKLKLKKRINILKKSWNISESPTKNQVECSKYVTSTTDLEFFNPQACSTQIMSQKHEDKNGVKPIKNSSSDSDTDFSFERKLSLKKEFPDRNKKIIALDVSKKSFLSEQRSDKNVEQQNRENQCKVTETTLDDETFFSLAEYRNEKCINDRVKPSTSYEVEDPSQNSKRVLIESFDRIPEKKKRSPEYAYAIKSVRRKCERAELDGWSCWQCKQYYEKLNLPEKKLKQYMKICSRHKAKFNPEYNTPPDFWNPIFADTFAATFRGLEN